MAKEHSDLEELIARKNELSGEFYDAEAEALKVQARAKQARAEISQINATLSRAGVELTEPKSW